MSKDEKIKIIKRNNKNTLSDICRKLNLKNSAVYHKKYSEDKYNQILLMMRSRNEILNESIDEVLKDG